MSTAFDVIVIGAGPGGYIAAIRAAQLGFKTACIDDWTRAGGKPAPGGTCTNVGCIPSKALLQSSENYEHAAHGFAEHGIGLKDLSIDVQKMVGRKQAVVKQNNDGILYLFKKNKVSFFHGRGSFVKVAADGGYEIKVAGATEETLVGKQIIIATGSNARALPGAEFDEVNILSNDGALRIGAVPKKLALIGSGVIGLEMGSVWRRLGADVTVLEGLPTFLGAVDEQIAKEAKKSFDKQGLKIELGVKIGEIKTGKKGKESKVSVAYTNAKGEAVALDVDKLIVSIGRVPNTIGLNAEAVGLQLGDRLQFDMGGVQNEARITSLRKVDWGSMRANFFVIYPVDTLADMPITYLAAFRAPDGYEFQGYANGGAGLMTGLFGGNRTRNGVTIAKDGAIVRIRLPVAHDWYSDIRFLGWVLE